MPIVFNYSEFADDYMPEMELWIKSAEVSMATNTKKTMMTLEEWIKKMTIAGVNEKEIERRVEQAFIKGDGAFATFRNTFIRRTVGTANLMERVPRDVDRTMDERFTWICMHVNSCEDCEALHGEIKKWSEWLDEGLPGSGHTQCQDNCNCELVSEGKASPNLKEAIDLAEERRKQIVEEGGTVHVK